MLTEIASRGLFVFMDWGNILGLLRSSWKENDCDARSILQEYRTEPLLTQITVYLSTYKCNFTVCVECASTAFLRVIYPYLVGKRQVNSPTWDTISRL